MPTSGMSNYLKGQIGKHIFRTGSFTKPTTLYVALFTSQPAADGTGTEVSGGSYARVASTPLDANWNDQVSGNGVFSNAVAITFPQPTGTWGVVGWFAIYDASTSGNMLMFGALTQQVTINAASAPPNFSAAQLQAIFS